MARTATCRKGHVPGSAPLICTVKPRYLNPMRPALGVFRPCCAVLLCLAFVMSPPLMAVGMARDASSEQSPPHCPGMPPGPSHHTLPRHCCALCALACDSAPQVAGGVAVIAAAPVLRRAAQFELARVRARTPSQFRLPYSIGPPILVA